MIDVKIIKKPKSNGTGTGGGSATYVSTIAIATEAKHALKADRATFAEQADVAAQANSAKYANTAGVAYELSDDSPVAARLMAEAEQQNNRLKEAILGGYLYNGYFGAGLQGWTAGTGGDTELYMLSSEWIWANNAALSWSDKDVAMVSDAGRRVLRVRNSYILQLGKDMRNIPTFVPDANDVRSAMPVTVSLYYRCVEAGTLNMSFENVVKTGFAAFEALTSEANLQTSKEYTRLDCSGMWNGTGDMKITCDGTIYIYGIVMTGAGVANVAYRLGYLMERNEGIFIAR